MERMDHSQPGQTWLVSSKEKFVSDKRTSEVHLQVLITEKSGQNSMLVLLRNTAAQEEEKEKKIGKGGPIFVLKV